MKSLIKICFTLVLLLSTSTIFASVSPDYVITAKGDHSFHLYLEKPGHTNVQVSITDDSGITLWSTQLKKVAFSKKFDLNNLPKGQYSLVIEDDLTIESQTIILEDNQLIIDPKMTKKIFKPTYRQHENFVSMIMLQQEEGNIKLAIKDNTGNEIFSESFIGHGSVQKQYDVNQLERGAYTFQLSANGKTFYQLIDIK